ncbi:MAG TPA: YceI family protein [Gemmatimonadales bacterium]
MSRRVHYRIDSPASRLSVRTFAGGALSVFGHDPTFVTRDVRGELTLVPDELTSASMRLVVNAESLTLSGEVNDADRREIERRTRQEVLDTASHPEIIYECPAGSVTAHGPTQLTLQGDLTLHGVTRPQPVSARLFLTGDTVRAQGEATLRQTDYGIRLVTAVGGMLRVKDELQLSFDIVARLVAEQEPAGLADRT